MLILVLTFLCVIFSALSLAAAPIEAIEAIRGGYFDFDGFMLFLVHSLILGFAAFCSAQGFGHVLAHYITNL